MTNPRDTGRYDAITDTWIDQQVKIDFAWGNLPIQPNDDREEELVYELDSHNIAIDGWAGYPQIDDLANSIVPQVPVPCTFEQYAALLEAVGLVAVEGSTITNTQNSGLNGQVTEPSPAPGALVPVGTSVTVNVLGTYNPQALVPDISGLAWVAANAAITGAGFTVGTNVTDVNTGNIAIANTVASQTPAAGTYANIGSAIDYHLYNYVAINYTIAGIRRDGLGNTQRHLYLHGRNSGIVSGNEIVLSGTGFDNYNRPFDVSEVIDDDSFNTGGQRLLINNGLMTLTNDEVTDTGTWAFY